MFFSAAPVLMVLNSKTLDFYLPSGQKTTFSFTPAIVDNLEIKDPPKFNQMLQDFLSASKIPKGKALLILSDEVVFRKEIPDKDTQKIAAAVDLFLSEIPLEPAKISHQVLRNNDNLYLVAVNQDLYIEIINTLDEYKLRVSQVVPLTATWVGQINDNTVKELLQNTGKLNFADFLSHTVTSAKLKQKATQKNSFSLPLFLAVILITAGVSGSLIYYISGKPQKQPPAKIVAPAGEITSTPKPTAAHPKVTPTPPAVKKIDKGKLKIQVLNGNGGEGVASAAKEILTAKGYHDIETGNAGKYDYENSVIATNKKEIFTALAEDLKGDYEVKKNPDPLDTDSPFDAVIIIGLK